MGCKELLAFNTSLNLIHINNPTSTSWQNPTNFSRNKTHYPPTHFIPLFSQRADKMRPDHTVSSATAFCLIQKNCISTSDHITKHASPALCRGGLFLSTSPCRVPLLESRVASFQVFWVSASLFIRDVGDETCLFLGMWWCSSGGQIWRDFEKSNGHYYWQLTLWNPTQKTK